MQEKKRAIFVPPVYESLVRDISLVLQRITETKTKQWYVMNAVTVVHNNILCIAQSKLPLFLLYQVKISLGCTLQ